MKAFDFLRIVYAQEIDRAVSVLYGEIRLVVDAFAVVAVVLQEVDEDFVCCEPEAGERLSCDEDFLFVFGDEFLEEELEDAVGLA